MSRTFDPIEDSVNDLAPLTMISASAGTGKTWTVTHVAARWLVEAEGRSPSSVLMVTFARDAAGELKGRLRERLEEMNSELDKKSSSIPWVLQLQKLASEIGHENLKSRINRVLNEIDNLNARTIHSFATALMRNDESFVSNAKLLRARAINETLVAAANRSPEELKNLLSEMKTTGDQVSRLGEMLAVALSVGLPLGGFGTHSLVQFIELSEDKEVEQVEKLDFLRCLIIEAADRESRIRQLSKLQTYDAVIGELVEEINRDPDTVRDRIGDQFQLVIIDEFQDTDSAQWRIFSQLFIETRNPVPVLVVGDAKQAIYGFRGGDVTIMQALQKEIASTENYAHSTLPVNWRSHSGLLTQINSFYTPNDSPHVFLNGDVDSVIDYQPVSSPNHLDDGLGLFQIRDLTKIKKGKGNEDPIFLDLIAEIQRLTTENSSCESRELPEGNPAKRWNYSDIVILCKTNGSIRGLQKELRYFRIPFVTPKSISVFSSIAAQEVRALFWALSSPGDQRRWRTLLATWFSWVIDSDLTATGLASLLETQGVSSVHREITNGWFLNEQLRHRSGQRDITDVEHIFGVLASEFPKGATAPEILGWLEDAISTADEADDGIDGQRRIESDENAVKLMTIHASKGLEFPVVLVADPEGMGRDPKLLSVNTKLGKSIDLESAFLESSDRKSAVRPQVIEENDRLIYVALTRATNVLTCWVEKLDESSSPAWSRLVSPWLVSQESESEPKSTEVAADGPKVVSISQGDFERNRPQRIKGGPNRLVGVEVRPIKRSAFEPNHRWSYSSLNVHGTTPTYSEDYTDSRTAAEDSGSEGQESAKGRRGYMAFGHLRGNNLGDAVHGVFEHVVGKISKDDEEELQRIIDREFRANGYVPPEGIRLVFQRLLNASLGPAWGGASLADYFKAGVAVSPEMRFTMPLNPHSVGDRNDLLVQICELVTELDVDGPFTDHFSRLKESTNPGRLMQGFLTGSIDLVAPTLEGDRKYILLDYKSNSLTITPDFSSTSLAVEMAASGYPLQALIYSVALHRHLSVWMRDYEPARHLGGATYYYVRGAGLPDASSGDGIFHWDIPPALTAEVSKLLRGAVS